MSFVVMTMTAKYVLVDYYSSEEYFFKYPIEDIRKLANSESGLPSSLGYLTIASGDFPDWAVAAGLRIENNSPFIAYQICYNKNGKLSYVIIDSAVDKTLYDKSVMSGKFFDAKKYDILEKAFLGADKIAFTHEHFDHIAGAAKSEHFDLFSSKLYLTKEQSVSRYLNDVGFVVNDKMKIIEDFYKIDIPAYGAIEYKLFSPGVVMIKTPGHTSGHSAFFVVLSDGNEILISGDIAWSMENITLIRQRPIITSMLLRENRDQVGKDLFWLNKLKNDSSVKIIVGHDLKSHEVLKESGIITEGFIIE